MNFLQKMSEPKREELRANIRQETDPLAIRRAHAILMVEEGLSAATIEAITGYRREVVVKLRRLFIRQGFNALRSKRKKKEPKALLTRSQKDQIVNVLNTQKPRDYGISSDFWTSTILGYLIEEQYGVKYKSKTSLYLIFKRARFTFHKPEKQSKLRNAKQIEEWKEKYKPIIGEECARNDSIVLVGDEAVMTSETRLQRIWLPSGKPAFVQDTTKRKAAHLYGFLNVQSGDAVAFKTAAQTGEITVSVLKNLTKHYPKKRLVIFWDNASWHKSKAVRDYLDQVSHFKLYNFPTYAPDLNPQEHVWKEMREKVLNNKLIADINKSAREAVAFINNTLFKYKFFGVHGTFNM